MKPAITLGAGAIVIAVAVLAFAMKGGDEAPEVIENEPTVQEPQAEEPEVALTEPEEPPAPIHEDLTVDEDGHVWGPLSFDDPQVKINGDGTVTVKKLARAYKMDGTMEEIPVTAILYPKRVPASAVKRIEDTGAKKHGLTSFPRAKAGLANRAKKNKQAGKKQ